jgi:hypothetical protein
MRPRHWNGTKTETETETTETETEAGPRPRQLEPRLEPPKPSEPNECDKNQEPAVSPLPLRTPYRLKPAAPRQTQEEPLREGTCAAAKPKQ